MQENNNQPNVEELAEQLKDELVATSVQYSSAKLAYVTFTDGRKKIKLRKWVADKANYFKN